MCGLAGFLRLGKTGPDIETLKGLWLAQEARGNSASGLAYVDPDRTTRYLKEPLTVSKLIPILPDEIWDGILLSRMAAFHTRFRTKGNESNPLNNHPIIARDWVVTHNGMISNDGDLWTKLGGERPGEVDSSAINLILSQSKSEAEIVGGLGCLSGSMVMAGWSSKYPETLILARTSGSDLYLAKDQKRNILYWSSLERAVQTAAQDEPYKLAGLNFQGAPTSYIPDYTALCFDLKSIRRYTIPTTPFFVARKTFPFQQRSLSAGGDLWGGKQEEATRQKKKGVVTIGLRINSPLKAGIIPLEDYEKLGKPAPLVSGLLPHHFGMRVPAVNKPTEMHTPYGRWFLSPEGPNKRFFRPHKRISTFWDTLPGGARQLPVPTASPWDKVAVVEIVRLVEVGGVISLGYMCPWCGVIETLHTWKNVWHNICQWCLVESKPPGGNNTTGSNSATGGTNAFLF